MPKIVDHASRREEIVEAARRIILREGIEAATTRAIAREAGYSNGVLTHYFADKDDIMLSALRSSHRRIVERLRGKLAGRGGLAALRELLWTTCRWTTSAPGRAGWRSASGAGA